MKRFTATEKWSDSWFRKLKPEHKNLWSYLLDNCDSAAVWKVDLELAAYYVGGGVNFAPKEVLEAFEGRVVDIGRGRWWIPGFIVFQYGKLSEKCDFHKSVLKNLEKQGLMARWEAYLSDRDTSTPPPTPPLLDVPSGGLKKEDKDKEEDKEKERGAGENPKPESEVLEFLRMATGKNFRPIDVNLKPIIARLAEVEGDVAGVKTMISRQCARWKGTDQEEYLRPETLFGKTKFHGYYAAKEMPVNGKKGATATDHAKGF